MKPIALAKVHPRHEGISLALRVLFGAAVLLTMLMIGVRMTQAAGVR